MELELRPVATAQIAHALKDSAKTDLTNIHLLVHQSEHAGWSVLFDKPQLGILRSLPTLTFENYTMLLQAAVSGIGIALAPTELIESELSTKRLVPIIDCTIKAQSTGYLVYPRENSGYLPLKAFRHWLLDAIKDSRATASP